MTLSAVPPLDLTRLRAAYAAGALSPPAVVEAILADIARRGDDGVWISLIPAERLRARAAQLAALPDEARAKLPLWGVPFAAKDNIDVAGAPTTAACPGFAYTPTQSATVVAKLEAAGAICIGKTNLDQFATGLVGHRSPYGVARNPFDPTLLPGGSSSGSAVAVAQGQVCFALGTDTAGSGRVPAGFNNLVGLKPTKGVLSTTGVVPACRSLDCVSIFALTVDDALDVLQVAAGEDDADAYSRASPPIRRAAAGPMRLGVPRPNQRVFFGDSAYAKAYDEALGAFVALGHTLIEVDLAPFLEAAALLYEGPWVAERTAAFGDFAEANPDKMWPVTLGFAQRGRGFSAVDMVRGAEKLALLRRIAAPVWGRIDAMLVPTAGRHYAVADLDADPLLPNANLGRYTNFVNLMDLAALAVPSAMVEGGRPFGVTLIGPAFCDARLAALGASYVATRNLPLGATGVAAPSPKPAEGAAGIELAVVGAHLSGQPLNRDLVAAGARLLRTARTEDCYRLYALAGGPPKRPGLVRVAPGAGAGIEVEVWDVPPAAVGPFAASIPSPLGLGRVRLDDGSQPLGFLCESAGVQNAEDITALGGWRAYVRAA